MSKYTKKDIIRLVEEEDVEFIRLQFTDMFGTIEKCGDHKQSVRKSIRVMNVCLTVLLSRDLSALKSQICICIRILDTFAIFPWRPQQGKGSTHHL